MNAEYKVLEPDKETLSVEYFDYLLYLALRTSKDRLRENRSIVVAGIYDPPSSNYYIGFSRNINNETGYGLWNHAEYEAIMLALSHGVDLSEAIAISSLGPCLIEGKNRAHQSCTELLIEAGIKKAHVGVLDTRQADIKMYKNLGLSVSVSENSTLLRVCDGLNGYFNPVKEQRLLGLEKTAYIDEILKDLPAKWPL